MRHTLNTLAPMLRLATSAKRAVPVHMMATMTDRRAPMWLCFVEDEDDGEYHADEGCKVVPVETLAAE